jgi:hypothetical protein
MELFREEYLTIQDDYLRVDPSREGSDNDDDLDYSNDQLGENSEITPLGDEIEEEDDITDYKIDPDDDDFDDEDDDDLDLDLDTEEIEEDERILDFASEIDPDDDDLEDDDDDLFDDDDDLDTAITPDLDDDDDLLSDEDDDDYEDDAIARTSINTDADFSSRPHGRVTGTMTDHEPGLPGS